MRRTFARGGVHPPQRKELTSGVAISSPAPPAIVTIPLHQSIGAPARAIVKAREEVACGQLIAEPGGFISAPVHASVSGKVKRIAAFPTSIGPSVECIQIESDGQDTWVPDVNLGASECTAALAKSPEDLLATLAGAGLVGLGGAAFPTAVKLRPPPGGKVDTLLLNGAECEPYLTADHRLMIEEAPGIIAGLRVLMRVLGIERAVIGIEDNKPDAVETMRAAVDEIGGVSVEVCCTAYPQGAEKQLIQAILGREVPSGKLPLQVGVVVQNVATAFAAFEAVVRHKPLIERVVTVSGGAVAEPKNLRVRIGTSLEDLVAHCGGVRGELGKLIMGGPMMGKALKSFDIPVVKATSGVLLMDEVEAAQVDEQACLRCGRCVQVCPQGLMPCDLAAMANHGRLEGFGDGADCVECGCCQFICPAGRRLVHSIRFGKSDYRRLKAAEKRQGA